MTTGTGTMADAVLSAWDVALTVYVPGTAGAVYTPAVDIAPPPFSTTDQVTDLFEAPLTDAL
jgi:hypothetical protein